MKPTGIKWALNTLQDLGYSICNTTPKTILKTPWSCVYCFDTDQGQCYLKQVPPSLYFEVRIINALREIFKASVPALIAINSEQHCFLMQDAGIQLREFFKSGVFNPDILVKAVHTYIAIQRASHDHLPFFLSIGVTDWRLTQIPNYYQELIHQEELLTADGLTKVEISQLSQLNTKLIALCEQLSAYPIPPTFSHSDFNDKNMLIHPQTKQITLVDLGEVEVTHPFFSLQNLLHHIKENYPLKDEAYQSLEQEILQPWLDLVSQEQLSKIMFLIQQCWSIHRALTVYRLLTSIDSNSSLQLLGQGKLAKNLKIWLTK
ncbi:MAG TPA: phosphotransferase [Gammaproteobacteria bacterium]|nr:phosphotransferase [Gammaproteobacteria bacterium]